MNNAIEMSELTKHFRDVLGRKKITAVQSLSLSVPKGRIFGLLGPNGCGKTTTLKMITGLLRPSSGHLKILGASPHDKQTRSRLGYLPEHSVCYSYLSGRDNLTFYASLFNLPRREAEKRIDALLHRVDLVESADRPAGEYSKGMLRRIGLAQALINQPDLLILDEPTDGLDPAGRQLVKDHLRSASGKGTTVIIASHLLADIESICDEVCILHQGKKIAEGTLRNLLELPEHTRFSIPGSLSPKQHAKIQKAFSAAAGSQANVDHPCMNLEAFFMDAVNKAERHPS